MNAQLQIENDALEKIPNSSGNMQPYAICMEFIGVGRDM